MIHYTEFLKNKQRSFNTFPINERTKSKEYASNYDYECDDILTLDLEASSAWLTPDGELIQYEPGKDESFWNSCESFSLCYIWQFSFNDTVYYGRDICEFKEVLEYLGSFRIHFIIFVHNLAYEAEYLQNICMLEGVFAREPHKPMYFYVGEYPNIEFRCSYVLTRLALASWAESLGE